MFAIFHCTEISTVDRSANQHLTAVAGTDFVGFANQVLNFNLNDDIESHTISLATNVDVEKQKYFEVCMANPLAGIIDAPECAVVYIEDDDCELTFFSFSFFLLF